MQNLHTRNAMRHADLSLMLVWDHFLNMGGIVDELEMDAYLHGVLHLPVQERDCVAQAVNELLDDLAMAGGTPCCRAPYSYGPLSEGRGGCAATDATTRGLPEYPVPFPVKHQDQRLPVHRGSHRKR